MSPVPRAPFFLLLPSAFFLSVAYTVIQHAMHIHPTVTELIPTMLGELKLLE
jgi:hypothetical protein